MFSQKFLLFLMIGLGLCQLLFSMGEGTLYAGYGQEDIQSIYKSNIVTVTQEGLRVGVPDISPKATEDNPAETNWVNTVVKTATWNYAILNEGLGRYIKQYLLWPLSLCLLIGFFLTLIAHIPVIGRGG